MATKDQKKTLQKMGCTQSVLDSAVAAGIPFNMILQLFMTFASKAIPMIEALIAAWKNPSPAPAPTTESAPAMTSTGCCDHHACCTKTFQLAMATAESAASHLCSCGDESGEG